MIEAIGSALTNVITWIGTTVTALTSSTGALYPLLPVFMVGVAISCVLLGVKMIRSLCWGA